MITFLLLLVAFACFTVETIRSRSLIAGGLAALSLAWVIGAWPG